MKPVKTLINQFRGINPHLHSYWQEEGNWISFHGTHLVYIARELNKVLRGMGYRAQTEQSIQVWRPGTGKPDLPRSDVVITDTNPVRAGLPRLSSESGSTVVLDLQEVLEISEEPYEYLAVSIKLLADLEGEPVAWIELLSPGNKQGDGLNEYQWKRRSLIKQGITFLELDYLHMTPPTLRSLPRYYYRQPHPDAAPYHIHVIHPHSATERGKIEVYPFMVDEPVPTIPMTLSAADVVNFRFDLAYQVTFEETLYGDGVDYSRLPVRFETYNERDQARILTRLIHVLRAAAAANNLEQSPQMLETLPLNQAWAEYQRLIQHDA